MARFRSPVLVWSAVGALVALAGGVGAWAASSGSGTKAPATAAPAAAPAGAKGGGSPGPTSTTSVATSSSGTGGGTTATVGPRPTAVPGPAPSTTTTAVVAPRGTLVLTQAEAGQTFSITVGQRVEVVLPGTGQPYQGFTAPQSDDPGAVAAEGTACPAPAGQFCTEFVGRGAGSARLVATSDPPCRQYSPPCEAASEVWWVNLAVH